MEKASVRLAYMLRHSKEPLYISLNGGWAQVSVILKELKGSFPWMNRERLKELVAQDAKGRYSFDRTGQRIRANQGHSIPGVVIEMEHPEPPELLYHGTSIRYLDQIMREGLKPMTRQWVHISPDIETALNVAGRHGGKPVILVIRARDFVRDGHELCRSDNGVWQARAVPPEYFTIQYVQTT